MSWVLSQVKGSAGAGRRRYFLDHGALPETAACAADVQNRYVPTAEVKTELRRREALAHPDGAYDGECIPAERAPGHIAEYLRLAAIRDWRRVAHRSARSGSRGDQPDCSGNGGARPSCTAGMADLHDPPSLRPVPAALWAAASRAGSRSAAKTRCSMCQSCG